MDVLRPSYQLWTFEVYKMYRHTQEEQIFNRFSLKSTYVQKFSLSQILSQIFMSQWQAIKVVISTYYKIIIIITS